MIICPNCGSNYIRLVNATSARFQIDSHGHPTFVDDSINGINYIREMASDDITNMEFKCMSCKSSYTVKEKENGDFEIGDEI